MTSAAWVLTDLLFSTFRIYPVNWRSFACLLGLSAEETNITYRVRGGFVLNLLARGVLVLLNNIKRQ